MVGGVCEMGMSGGEGEGGGGRRRFVGCEGEEVVWKSESSTHTFPNIPQLTAHKYPITHLPTHQSNTHPPTYPLTHSPTHLWPKRAPSCEVVVRRQWSHHSRGQLCCSPPPLLPVAALEAVLVSCRSWKKGRGEVTWLGDAGCVVVESVGFWVV